MQTGRIYSVSELNSSIRTTLETRFSFVSVTGEISNLRRPLSGHLYFTLKDSQAQIKVVLFKMQQRYLSRQPQDGQQILCHGRLSVYEPRGEYQLIVDTIDFQGTGALQLSFEQLKQKLAAEGLFAEHLKKKAPAFPGHITLVTSPRGAAVHDFIKVAGKRYPGTELAVYPVAVQGENAASEICEAIETINRISETEIIVLCRGGGSIEDLWPFNEEKVARAIHRSKIVVVSAVGHEIDFTIADFVADMRAPTPSAAAELLLPDRETLKIRINLAGRRLLSTMRSSLDGYSARLQLYRQILGDMSHPLEHSLLKLDHCNTRMEQAIDRILAKRQKQIDQLGHRLEQVNPAGELKLKQQQLNLLKQRLMFAGSDMLDSREEKLAQLAGVLDAVSPLATLARGYSIARVAETGKVITDADDVCPKSRIEVILHRGRLGCIVENTGK